MWVKRQTRSLTAEVFKVVKAISEWNWRNGQIRNATTSTVLTMLSRRKKRVCKSTGMNFPKEHVVVIEQQDPTSICPVTSVLKEFYSCPLYWSPKSSESKTIFSEAMEMSYF